MGWHGEVQGGAVGELEPWWTELRGRRRKYIHSWPHKRLRLRGSKAEVHILVLKETEFWDTLRVSMCPK